MNTLSAPNASSLRPLANDDKTRAFKRSVAAFRGLQSLFPKQIGISSYETAHGSHISHSFDVFFQGRQVARMALKESRVTGRPSELTQWGELRGQDMSPTRVAKVLQSMLS